MNWIGLDYGRRYIGVAVGHSATQKASPLETISARKGVPDWQALDGIIAQWQPAGIVLGYPTRLDGTKQSITRHVDIFRKNLVLHYRLPCYLVCEQLTSHAARDQLAPGTPKSQIDSLAAAIILQQWFDSGMPESSSDG